MKLRRATHDEAPTLTSLALRSKQYWGYDDSFIHACREELTVTADTIDRRAVTVCDEDGRILGFSVLGGEPSDTELELEWLFVEPAEIGRGVGRALWNHAVEASAAHGVGSIRIESDPHAEGFYRQMGASRDGSVPSRSVAGRWNPLMRFAVPTSSEASDQ